MTDPGTRTRPSSPAVIGLVVAAVLLTVAGPAWAHNPALSVHPPAPLGDGLLVLGEEGTAALLSPQGEEIWRETTGLHVLQGPVGHGELVATIGRNITTLDPQVVAFDAEGIAWRADIGQPEAFGYLHATEAGFLAATTNGTLTELDADGQVTATARIEGPPGTAPIPRPGGGWYVGTRTGSVLAMDQDGQVVAQHDTGQPITDVTIWQGDVLAAHADIRERTASLTALTPELEPTWKTTLPGFRVGGQIALLEEAVAIGTFRPDGAMVALIAPGGEVAWDTTIPNTTAAAVTTDGHRLYASVSEAVIALDLDGQVLWRQADPDPQLTSPGLLPAAGEASGLVLPAGADDRLVALDAATGEVAWTWTDGTSQVPWTDETLGQGAPGDDAGPDPEEDRSTPWPGLFLLMILVGLAAGRRGPGRW